jgi:hypothetical protein
MHGEGDVIVSSAVASVGIPAVAQVEFLELVKGRPHILRLGRGADPGEAEIHQDAEELPVVRPERGFLHLAQPRHEVALRGGRERLPHFLRHDGEGEAERRHLDVHLPRVALIPPPELRVRRVRSVCEPVLKEIPAVEFPAARRQRSETPERPREPLEFRLGVRKDGPSPPQAHAGPARTEMRDERFHQPKKASLQLRPRLQGIVAQMHGRALQLHALAGRIL